MRRRLLSFSRDAMFEYRITKYDPANRDPTGVYLLNTWTSRSDIGKVIDGALLTPEEYNRFEEAYIATAVAFLQESGCKALTVNGLECHRETPPFQDGDSLSVPQIAEAISGMLREEYWCRLEWSDAFIHIGYDYYMYLGVMTHCPKAIDFACEKGLFVEPFESPYKALD
jgi:hypothetical protein